MDESYWSEYMALLGTLVNGALIIVGVAIGLLFRNIPERMKETVLFGIGLVVLLLGIQMALEGSNIVLILLSVLSGAVIGESMQLEEKLNAIGHWIESKFSIKNQGNIAQGFITATLIFVIGAMAVIGALDSGLRNDHEVLITKAFLDGFMALILTSTLGFGVIFSVIPVVLYQGSIALGAAYINQWIPQSAMELFITELTATGGLLIIAIGLNILQITKIRIANLLPSILTLFIFWSIYTFIF